MIEKIHGEIIGYRWWVVCPRAERLYPLVGGRLNPSSWEKAETTAFCAGSHPTVKPRNIIEWYNGKPTKRSRQHVVPSQACQCGLYAHHRPWHGMGWTTGYGCQIVHGAVQGWGRMCIHPERDGWRAQYARIVALAIVPLRLPPTNAPNTYADAYTLYKIAMKYGVHLVPPETLETVASEYGNPAPLTDYQREDPLWQ